MGGCYLLILHPERLHSVHYGAHDEFQAFAMYTYRPWAAGHHPRIDGSLVRAVHTVAMATTFAIRDASINPEYLEDLRNESESSVYERWEATGAGMPFLDSFLGE